MFSQKKPFGETLIFENHNQSYQIKEFSSSRKLAKSEMLRSPLSLRLAIAKNYTIFKALGKKSGSRKQVHLCQVTKVSHASCNNIW